MSGSITRRHNQRVRNVAAVVPDDHLLIETDTPVIIPYAIKDDTDESIPVSDGPNLQESLVHVALELAAIRGTDAETISVLTNRNARRLFG